MLSIDMKRIRTLFRWSLALFLIGCAVSYGGPLLDPFFFFCAALFLLSVCLFLHKSRVTITCVLCAMFLFGGVRVQVDRAWERAFDNNEGAVSYEGEIIQESVRGNQQTLIIDLARPVHMKGGIVAVTARLNEKGMQGSRILFTCDLTAGELNSFTRRHHISSHCFARNVEVIPAPHFSWRAFFASRHAYFEDVIRRAIPSNPGALLSGLLMGTPQLSPERQADFRASGLSHIVAASGSNIALVIILFGSLLTVLRIPKWMRIPTILASIILYTFLTGAASATVRAACMALIVIGASVASRKSGTLDALFFAAGVLIAWTPTLLLFDVGFQLSVAATLGLVIGQPLFEKIFSFISMKGFRALLAQTFAAQAFTVPLIMVTFGNFSFISFVANIMVVPLVPWATLIGSGWFVIALVESLISFTGGSQFLGILAAPLIGLLQYILDVAWIGARIPLSYLTIHDPVFRVLVAATWIAGLSALFMRYGSRTQSIEEYEATCVPQGLGLGSRMVR